MHTSGQHSLQLIIKRSNPIFKLRKIRNNTYWSFRPRRWAGKTVSNGTNYQSLNLSKDNKRPLAAVADNTSKKC